MKIQENKYNGGNDDTNRVKTEIATLKHRANIGVPRQLKGGRALQLGPIRV